MFALAAPFQIDKKDLSPVLKLLLNVKHFSIDVDDEKVRITKLHDENSNWDEILKMMQEIADFAYSFRIGDTICKIAGLLNDNDNTQAVFITGPNIGDVILKKIEDIKDMRQSSFFKVTEVEKDPLNILLKI